MENLHQTSDDALRSLVVDDLRNDRPNAMIEPNLTLRSILYSHTMCHMCSMSTAHPKGRGGITIHNRLGIRMDWRGLCHTYTTSGIYMPLPNDYSINTKCFSVERNSLQSVGSSPPHMVCLFEHFLCTARIFRKVCF